MNIMAQNMHKIELNALKKPKKGRKFRAVTRIFSKVKFYLKAAAESTVKTEKSASFSEFHGGYARVPVEKAAEIQSVVKPNGGGYLGN